MAGDPLHDTYVCRQEKGSKVWAIENSQNMPEKGKGKANLEEVLTTTATASLTWTPADFCTEYDFNAISSAPDSAQNPASVSSQARLSLNTE